MLDFGVVIHCCALCAGILSIRYFVGLNNVSNAFLYKSMILSGDVNGDLTVDMRQGPFNETSDLATGGDASWTVQ